MNKVLLILLLIIEFSIDAKPVFIPNFYSYIKNECLIDEPMDTLMAGRFLEKGNEFIKTLEYDSSILYLNKARVIYEQNNLWENYLWENYFSCGNLTASVLREKGEVDSSLTLLKNNLDSAKKYLGKDNLTYAKMKNLLGYDYKIIGELDSALIFATESLEIQKDKKAFSEAADTYYLLGTIYFNKGEFDSSLTNLNLALNIIDTLNQKILISNIYNTMGEVYQQKGDPERAIDYYKNSIAIKLKESSEFDQELTAVYNNLAVVYFYLEDNDTALEYYLKALSINLHLKNANKIDIGIEYNNIAMAYRVNGNYDEALRYRNLSKELLTKYLGENHPTVGAIINNTGRTYFDLKKYDKAISLYQNALSIWEKKFGEIHPYTAQANFNIGEALKNHKSYKSALEFVNKSLSIRLSIYGAKHPKISESYKELGEIYFAMQNFDSALYYYQKSIISLSEGFNDSNIYENPEVENILWNLECLDVLSLKVDAFNKIYYVDKNLKDLLEAYTSAKLANQLVDKIRHGFKAEGSKLSFSNKAFSVYAKGIDISLKLYGLTNNEEYLKTAFKFSEEGKAAVLFDAVSEVKARNYSGIPDSLLKEEKDLRTDLAYYETQILNEKQKKNTSDDVLNTLNNKYFSSHQKYISLLDSFEKNYLSYYQLKFKEKDISVDNLQSTLDNQSAIIEYFLTDTTLCTFVLKKQSLKNIVVKLDSPLKVNINKFRESLQNIDINNYISSALSLYDVLIKPVENKISGVKNLIVIPEGILNYLPFEALLTRKIKATDDINFSSLPYLIKDFNISYHFSASFFQKNKRQKNSFSFAGFAPVFSDESNHPNKITGNDSASTHIKRAIEINDKKYSALPETKIEVESILSLFEKYNFKGTSFISENAREEVLKSDIIKDYSFIHIATHGFINEDKPKLSGLLFTDKNNSLNEDGILYSDEIYNLNLNADLVVLSACESGLGKVIKGEGIMGLTRGFIYSGAKNIIVSLWQVADKSTSELMIEFYKNVLNGDSYSSALRKAKLRLIKSEKYAYPLEWSPFILIGRLIFDIKF